MAGVVADALLTQLAQVRRVVDDINERERRGQRYADAVAGVDYELKKREIARAVADDKAQGQAEREAARTNTERYQHHQANYADSFDAMGLEAPMPIADEASGSYRRRLFAALQHRLPAKHQLAGFDPGELDIAVLKTFEPQLRAAIAAEAEQPPEDNLPLSVNDPWAARVVTDPTSGARVIKLRLFNPNTKQWGVPPPRTLSERRPKPSPSTHC
jgi:hypothetical protein